MSTDNGPTSDCKYTHSLTGESTHTHRPATEDEQAVYAAIDSMSPDAVAELIQKGTDINTVNNRGQTPLATALLRLRYYRNSFATLTTSVYYVNSLVKIIEMLVPLTNNINSWWGFINGQYALRLSIQCDVMSGNKCVMKCSALLHQHGAMMSFNDILNIAIRQREVWNTRFALDTNFLQPKYIKFLRLSGVPFTMDVQDAVPVSKRAKYRQFTEEIRDMLLQPMPLLDICNIRVRRLLMRNSGRLWSNIDKTPLPTSIKRSLKVVSDEYAQH